MKKPIYTYYYDGEIVSRDELIEILTEQYEEYDYDYSQYVQECKEDGIEPLELIEWAGKTAEEQVQKEERYPVSMPYDKWRVMED